MRLIEQRVGFNEALVYFPDSMIQFISRRLKNSPDELGTTVPIERRAQARSCWTSILAISVLSL